MRAVLSCLFFMLLAGFVRADEPAKFMKFYSWWDGSWDVELKKDGKAEELSMTITRPESDVHLVQGFGVGLWGYDPKREKWVGTGFADDGSFFTTVLKSHPGEVVTPGMKQEATTTTKNADGTITKGQETWTYVDENTATIVVKTTDEDGEVSSFKYTCKRRK